jgi:hypothetical protein
MPSQATRRDSRRPRALFAGDLGRFEDMVAQWPQDVRDHATMLAGRALAQ